MVKERPLAGHVALVTGSARNLPAVIAIELARAGAEVVVSDVVSDEDLLGVVRTIREEGGTALAVPADVTRRDQLIQLVAQVRSELGVIDLLVNGVGPFAGGRFLDLPEESWDLVFDGNLKSIYLLAQVLAPGMKAKRWGRIINLSAGSADYRSASVYGLAKAAVRVLTQFLAVELGPEITVNCLSPGQIAESAPVVSEIDHGLVERTIKHTPSGRLVTRAEIARMVVLIGSSAFDSVTGETIRMDGGWGIPRS